MNAHEIAHKAARLTNFDLVAAAELCKEWEIKARDFARTTDLESDWRTADVYSYAKIIARSNADDCGRF